MFCSNCGSQIADGQRFCSICGAALTQPAQPPYSGQPTPPSYGGQPTQPPYSGQQQAQQPPYSVQQQQKEPQEVNAVVIWLVVLLCVALMLVVGMFVWPGFLRGGKEGKKEQPATQTVEEQSNKEESEAGGETDKEHTSEADDSLVSDTPGTSDDAAVADGSPKEAGNADEKTYSTEQIVSMAMEYTGAEHGEVLDVSQDGMIDIHLFNYNEEGNTATIDWLTIDPKTLKGTNLFDKPVDLTPYAK